MLKLERNHYIFHYHPDILAQKDIEEIAEHQEACFEYICQVLGIVPPFRIEYFLCSTPEEVGQLYGDNEPCNGFTRLPNQIYAVYNESVKCIGFHEDAHIISYCINRPPNSAVREGLAMFFDRKWWGISNHDWTLYYLSMGKYLPIDQLIENQTFFAYDCSVTYPIVGAFTEYLILRYGIERYLAFYRYTQNAEEAFCRIFEKTLHQANHDFIAYTKLFTMDNEIKNRIETLIS